MLAQFELCTGEVESSSQGDIGRALLKVGLMMFKGRMTLIQMGIMHFTLFACN